MPVNPILDVTIFFGISIVLITCIMSCCVDFCHTVLGGDIMNVLVDWRCDLGWRYHEQISELTYVILGGEIAENIHFQTYVPCSRLHYSNLNTANILIHFATPHHRPSPSLLIREFGSREHKPALHYSACDILGPPRVYKEISRLLPPSFFNIFSMQHSS